MRGGAAAAQSRSNDVAEELDWRAGGSVGQFRKAAAASVRLAHREPMRNSLARKPCDYRQRQGRIGPGFQRCVLIKNLRGCRRYGAMSPCSPSVGSCRCGRNRPRLWRAEVTRSKTRPPGLALLLRLTASAAAAFIRRGLSD